MIPADATEPPPIGRAGRLGLLVALAAAALVHARGLAGELVYDDLLLVARNPLVTDPARFWDLFTSGLWDFLDPEEARRIGYWRPLTGAALALGHRLGGGAPSAFHAVSLAVHLGATLATWALARRLARSETVAAAAALLFGLHPVGVEAVAWISAVNDPLVALFVLLALERWLAWRERGSRGVPLAAAGLALLAMLSKEAGVAVLPAALALDLALRREAGRPLRASLGPALPGYGALGLALGLYWLARVAVFGELAAGLDRTVTEFGVPAARLMVLRAEMLGGALWLLAWPVELQLFRPFVPSVSLADPPVARAILCLGVAIVVARDLWRRGSGPALAALLLVAAALLPMALRVRSLGIFPLSERFLYLSIAGFATALAIAAFRWLPRRAAWAAVALVAAGYGARSWTRQAVWRSEETLFRAEAEASPESPYVHWGMGRVMLETYRRTRDPRALYDSVQAYERALDLLEAARDGNARIFATRDDALQSNLGNAWAELYLAEAGGWEGDKAALMVFDALLQNHPDEEQAHTGRGVALMALGRAQEAEEALLRAIEINPRLAEAHKNLGVVRMRRGDFAGAAGAFEQALAQRPDHLDDQVWLARALAEGGETARALEVAARAAARHPDAAAPLVLQATIAARGGEVARALELAERALERDREDGEAWHLKAKLHLARGEKASAWTALDRATQLMPKSFEAHYNAAALLLETEGVAAALPYLERAYALVPSAGSGETDGPGATLRATLRQLEFPDPQALARFATADWSRGRDDDALYWIDRLLALRPDDGSAHFKKGEVLDRQGDREGALASWRRARELLPDNPRVEHALGTLLATLGRKDEAREHLGRALALLSAQQPGPDSAPAIEALRAEIEALTAGDAGN